MEENGGLLRETFSGLEFLKAMIDGKAPVPAMAQTIPTSTCMILRD